MGGGDDNKDLKIKDTNTNSKSKTKKLEEEAARIEKTISPPLEVAADSESAESTTRLTPLQLLSVFINWVLYEKVTMKFVKEHMREDRSCMTMWIDGPKYGWEEKRWEQGN